MFLQGKNVLMTKIVCLYISFIFIIFLFIYCYFYLLYFLNDFIL